MNYSAAAQEVNRMSKREPLDKELDRLREENLKLGSIVEQYRQETDRLREVIEAYEEMISKRDVEIVALKEAIVNLAKSMTREDRDG